MSDYYQKNRLDLNQYQPLNMNNFIRSKFEQACFIFIGIVLVSGMGNIIKNQNIEVSLESVVKSPNISFKKPEIKKPKINIQVSKLVKIKFPELQKVSIPNLPKLPRFAFIKPNQAKNPKNETNNKDNKLEVQASQQSSSPLVTSLPPKTLSPIEYLSYNNSLFPGFVLSYPKDWSLNTSKIKSTSPDITARVYTLTKNQTKLEIIATPEPKSACTSNINISPNNSQDRISEFTNGYSEYYIPGNSKNELEGNIFFSKDKRCVNQNTIESNLIIKDTAPLKDKFNPFSVNQKNIEFYITITTNTTPETDPQVLEEIRSIIRESEWN
jgi:hypothetical protein